VQCAAALAPGRGAGHQPHAEGHPVFLVCVQRDLEGVHAGTRQGEIEDQHGARFHVHHPRRRLTEVHRTFPLDQFVPLVVHEPDPHPVLPDLGAPAPQAEHQVSARMHRGEVRHPHVLKEPEDRELALLVDEGIVRQNREIEQQGQLTRMETI
jgi:hypothetical protein